MSLKKYILSVPVAVLVFIGVVLGLLYWPVYSGFMEANAILLKIKDMK